MRPPYPFVKYSSNILLIRSNNYTKYPTYRDAFTLKEVAISEFPTLLFHIKSESGHFFPFYITVFEYAKINLEAACSFSQANAKHAAGFCQTHFYITPHIPNLSIHIIYYSTKKILFESKGKMMKIQV